MNVALSTFLIFIFLLPGICFRRFYYTEQFSKEYFKQTVFGLFLSTLIPSLFIQSLWFYLVQIFGYKVDLMMIEELMSKEPESLVFRNLQNNLFNIIFYYLTIILFSSLSGYFLKILIRNNKLDRRYKLFRFRNNWHYILSGEFFDFKKSAYDLTKDSPEEIDYIFVDALVQTKEGTIIYEGIFFDYELSDELGLDTITLREVRRRYLQYDYSNKKSKYYHIPGHILVLKYSEIINLNFSYCKLNFNEDNNLIPVLIE